MSFPACPRVQSQIGNVVNKSTRRADLHPLKSDILFPFHSSISIAQMSIEVSPSPPGSPMTGLSSYPSTEQLRTISEGTTHPSSVSSDLSSLSLLADIEDGKSGHKDAVEIKPKPKGDSAGKKRRRDSSAIDAVAKKPKIDMDGENKEKGIYCHQ